MGIPLILSIAVIGSLTLLGSHAATPTASVEAESGVLSGATQISDASASGGTAVRFSASAATTKHYAANTNSGQATALSLGFNIVDITGSTSNPSNTKATVDALPAGVQALVWVGNLDNAPTAPCPSPGFTDAQFQAVVDTLAGDQKVFGYYLSDEPHPAICPNAAPDIKARADYIHTHDPSHKSFIIILDGSNQCGTNLGCEYAALGPAQTDIDLVGLDPYPCHYNGSTAVPCDNSKITASYNTAIASGISASAIVPVYQTFGQEGRIDGKTVYYRTPTASELTSMIATWAGLLPNPVMDYAYTFGIQCTASVCVAPQALTNHPELQTVVQQHNN